MIKILAVVAMFILVAVFLINKQEGVGLTEDTSQVASDDTNESEVTGNDSLIRSDEILDLSGQGLLKTPSYVFDKTDIQKLDLSNNNLDGSLQAEVRLLQDLKVLDLSNNQFTGVPAEIGQLKNLEVLDLSNNQITGLPYELGNLPNLELLDLRGNNYAPADLEMIKKNLSSTTEILTD